MTSALFNKLPRRAALKLALAGLFASLGAAPVFAQPAGEAAPPKEIRIGFQKGGILFITKQRGLFEQRFKDAGATVKWVEFPFGPPLLEALSAGAVDYGYTGDAPPVFAQAARANIRYVASIPARGEGQAIVVRKDSPIKTLQDLKGRNIGVGKGSSAHNLLVAALESVKLPLADVTVSYLAPSDAAAALARGSIDAWSIWDPYFAIAETTLSARPLPIDPAASIQNAYFLANKDFLDKYPNIVKALNEDVGKTAAWANDHRDEAAKAYSESSGVPYEAQKRAIDRAEFTFGPVTDKIVAEQQAVADRFFRSGLIPRAIVVRDYVWDKSGS